MQKSSFFLCRHKITQELVIIEKFHYDAPDPSELISFLSKQTLNRKVLSATSTFLHTYDSVKRPKYTWYICENFEGFPPFERIHNNPLPVNQAKYLFFLLTETLLILHNHLLCMCDWDPNNFLMTDAMIKCVNYSALRSCTAESVENQLLYITDPRWMSPESILQKSYDLVQADLWGLGLYLHFFLTGKMLFENSSTMYKDLKHFKYETPTGIDPAAANILSNLLVLDPKKRIKLREILSHSFLIPTVPFPISRVPLEGTPEIIEWMDFFGYDLKHIFTKIMSLVCDDSTLIFCLCVKCIEKGRKPSDYLHSQNGANSKKGSMILPQSLDGIVNKDNRLSRSLQLNSHCRSLSKPNKLSKSQQRSQSLHKLLSICSSELSKRDTNINHLDAFVEDDASVINSDR